MTKIIKRDSFVFYKSFYEGLKDLSDKDRLEMYDNIIKYAINGEKINLIGFNNQLFSLIKPQLDANNIRYENGKKGGKYGNMGGRPKNPSGVSGNNPSGVRKITPNVNVNVNENENEKQGKNLLKKEQNTASVTDLKELDDFVDSALNI